MNLYFIMMKKTGLLLTSLVAISFLASCGKTYTVTWKDYDGTILEVDEKVAEGAVPSFDKEIPTREPDSRYVYTFNGWDGDITKGIKADTTFTAQYESKPFDYYVTFKKDGQDDIKKGYIKENPVVNAPTFDNPPMHYEGHWVSDSKVVSSGESITFSDDELHDWTFTYQETPISYAITFIDGSGKVDEQEIKIDDLSIKAPTHSSTTHYDGCWKDEDIVINSGATFTFTEAQLSNHTFIWTETKHSYSVIFKDDIGQVDEQEIKINESSITAPSHLTSEHYDGCWKDGDIVINSGEEFTFTEAQLSNHTFIWTETEHPYKVKFMDSSSLISEQEIKISNLSIKAPTHSSTIHYDGCWKDGDIVIDSGATFTFTEAQLSDYLFTWNESEHSYSITFVDSSGSSDVRKINLSNLSITAPTHSSTTHYDGCWKEGDTIINSGEAFTFTKDQLGDHTFTWTETEHQYEVKFMDGSTQVDEEKISLSKLSIRGPKHSTTKHYDGCWQNEKFRIDSEHVITISSLYLADYTFTWTETEIPYTITFKDDTGVIAEQEVNIKSSSITAPSHLTSEHYDGCWKDEDIVINSGATFTFTEAQLSDHTFIWTETKHSYSVIFKDDIGQVDEQEIKINESSITAPTHSSTTYYDGCWKDGDIVINSGEEFTFTEAQLSNHTFIWTETEHQYKVAFIFKDSSSQTMRISKSNRTIIAPMTTAEPQTGRRCVWLSSTSSNITIESGAEYTFSLDQLDNFIFREEYVTNVYSINYVYDVESGTIPDNPTSYKVTDTITLTQPTQDGFTFSGWYLDANKTQKLAGDGWNPEEVVGDVTIYADWHVKDKTLASYSWEEISAISATGRADKYFDIGETKTVSLYSKNHNVRIIGFNHDPIAENLNKTAGITFEFADEITKNGEGVTTLYNDSQYFNFSNTTLNNFLNNNSDCIFSQLPSSLRGQIKQVNKNVVRNTGKIWELSSYKTKLFPLAHDEITTVKSEYAMEGEGTTYEYYVMNDNDEARKKTAVGGDINQYWLRSPALVSGAQSAWFVYTNGELGGYSGDFLSKIKAVAPAFCI